MESLKTMSIAEVQRQSTEKDTMMDINSELVPEVVLVQLIQEHS